MNKKIQYIDEETRSVIKNIADYVHGVVFVSDDYVEFGWFKSSPDNIMVSLGGRYSFDRINVPGISKEALPKLIWSNKLGYYINPKEMTDNDLIIHKKVLGQGNFPYYFPKFYEAADNFSLFKDTQKIVNKTDHPLSKYLDYTFGLEFETSMGYIPQELCFRDGLIPLRDGSIAGIEYSTVVLKGNDGLCLLEQELDTLRKYTRFNKECALHIHMGGYPVNPIDIFALYCVWYKIERDLYSEEYIPNYSFNTKEYKANGKDYCKLLPSTRNFEEYFALMTGRCYLGSLTQPHPSDIEKRAKWNIRSRYYGLNLINMLCYKGPKTVEFRFLRPTFNRRKIILWLYIFNAVLKYAESLGQKWRNLNPCPDNTEEMQSWIFKDTMITVTSILEEVYKEDEELMKYLTNELNLLKISTLLQHKNGDLYGRDTFFEEELFT